MCIAAVSVLVAIVSTIAGALRNAPVNIGKDARQQSVFRKGLQAHISSLGGMAIYTFKGARALCVLALLVIYAYDFARNGHSGSMASLGVLDLALFLTYVGFFASYRRLGRLSLLQLYASGLALLDIAARPPIARVAAPHLIVVLIASCAVYGLRDVWPLMTYTLQPLDVGEGTLLWVKIALLAVAGIVIPLTIPREYVPLDPEVRPSSNFMQYAI